MSILVTGTGGGAGQSILKSLQHTQERVIAADGEPLATGLYSTGKGYIIPYAASPDFVPRLLEICSREEVQILFPGLDAELPVLSRHRHVFAASGVTVVVSDEDVIQICDDKLLTARFLKQHGFPAPQTWVLSQLQPADFTVPLVIKPKSGGARSIGVRLIKTSSELAKALSELDGNKYVAQEFIEGPEFSCGSVTLNGQCIGAITARRTLRDGDTYKAFIERNETLETFIMQVGHALQAFGPCNFQLRIRDQVPYIFEFNGRCSGTTYCRALAGFNEPKMIIDFLLRNEQPSFSIRPVTILRYWKELLVENESIETCETLGHINSRSGLL